MQEDLHDIWKQARSYYLFHLSDRDRVQIAEVTSQQDLLNHVRLLEAQYSKPAISSGLRKTQALIAQLGSFSCILETLSQSSSGLSALIWGPLALILKLASRHHRTLEAITNTLEKFERALPRFIEYVEEFSCRLFFSRLRESLVLYYTELIAHYQDSIKFLQSSQIKNILLLHRPASRYYDTAVKRLELLREKTSWVEEEVSWAKYQIQKEQYKTLVELLNAGRHREATMDTQLPYRDLPYQRNHHFRFRDSLIDSIQLYLNETEPSSGLRTTGLFGLGGVGKTQLALEYAYRYAESYDSIFWIKGQTEEKLRESLCKYGRLAQTSKQPVSQQDTVLIAAFQKWLISATVQGRPLRWLAIIDNASDAQIFQNLWPGVTRGSVIVTTRSSEVAWALTKQVIEVPLFTRVESHEFMISLNPNPNIENDTEFKAVAAIADRLGDLPLALNYISTYIRRTSSSFRTFLAHYKDFDSEILFYENSGVDLSYEMPICATWTMTLGSISPTAKILMETIVLFDPDGVPMELLHGCDVYDKIYNGPLSPYPALDECLVDRFPTRQVLDEAVSALLNGALIAKSPESEQLSCHRIVRKAVLHSLSPDNLSLHFDWAIFALNGRFPKTFDNTALWEEWEQCASFYPQVPALLEIYTRFANVLRPPVLLCEVLRRCAWYLLERGNFRGAHDIVTKGCNILELAVETKTHPGYSQDYICRLTADMYNTFGLIEYEQNIAGHGRHWFEKADSHRMKLIEDGTFESWDLQTMAVVDGNIALTHLAAGVPGPAIGIFSFLISTFENERCRNVWAQNLANAYRVNGQLDESLACCRQAFDWARTTYGKESLSIASVHFTTASTLLSMRRENDAIAELEKCLRIRQQKSSTHPYLGFTYHKVGSLFRSQGDFSNSISFFRRAVNILKYCEAFEGAMARSMYVLAATLKDAGSLNESAKVHEEALAILSGIREGVDSNDINEAYFDQLVLYSNR